MGKISKYTIQVLTAVELRRRLPRNGPVTAFSCHPGEVYTNIGLNQMPWFLKSAYRDILPWIILSPENGELHHSILTEPSRRSAFSLVTLSMCCTIAGSELLCMPCLYLLVILASNKEAQKTISKDPSNCSNREHCTLLLCKYLQLMQKYIVVIVYLYDRDLQQSLGLLRR